MVGLDKPEPNARGERVRLRQCKQCSEKRESPGFIRGECQIVAYKIQGACVAYKWFTSRGFNRMVEPF